MGISNLNEKRVKNLQESAIFNHLLHHEYVIYLIDDSDISNMATTSSNHTQVISLETF